MRTYSICPRDSDNELSIASAIQAIHAAFPTALVDAEQGRNRATQTLDRLRSLDAPPVVQEVYVKGANDAVLVDLNEPSAKPFMLMPGEGIHFSTDSETLARKLSNTLG